MTSQIFAQPFSSLRVITQRLSSATTQQLPQLAHDLTSQFSLCGKELKASGQAQSNGVSSEVTIHVVKLKTQLSTLLLDKTPDARYAAVILIKATIEAGGWSILPHSGLWARNLVSILERQDSSITKNLCIITLTRIFLLTHENQSLVRDITTPVLPAFVAACLNLVRPNDTQTLEQSLQLVVMQALTELVPLHPASFRPFTQQIQSVILPLIASASSQHHSERPSTTVTEAVANNARRLFVQLHVCGPNGTAAEEWSRSIQNVLESAVETTDQILRGLVENSSSPIRRPNGLKSDSLEKEIEEEEPGPLPLPAWKGIDAGVQRLNGLLGTIRAYVTTRTLTAVSLPSGRILSLLERILSALPPDQIRIPKTRPELSRGERDGIFTGLSRLHLSALYILLDMISRLRTDFPAVSQAAMVQAFSTLENESGNEDVRKACFEVIAEDLAYSTPPLSDSNIQTLSTCISLCCTDLLPTDHYTLQNGDGAVSGGPIPPNRIPASPPHLSLIPSQSKIQGSNEPTKISEIAQKVLTLALTKLPREYLPHPLRNQILRAAVLSNSREMMFASVTRPGKAQSGRTVANNILPLFSRAYPHAQELETLLRPHLPPLQANPIQDLLREEERAMKRLEESTMVMPGNASKRGSEGLQSPNKRTKLSTEEVESDESDFVVPKLYLDSDSGDQ